MYSIIRTSATTGKRRIAGGIHATWELALEEAKKLAEHSARDNDRQCLLYGGRYEVYGADNTLLATFTVVRLVTAYHA